MYSHCAYYPIPCVPCLSTELHSSLCLISHSPLPRCGCSPPSLRSVPSGYLLLARSLVWLLALAPRTNCSGSTYSWSSHWATLTGIELQVAELDSGVVLPRDSAAVCILFVVLYSCQTGCLFPSSDCSSLVSTPLCSFDWCCYCCCRCRTLYEKYLEWNPANASAWLKYAELELLLAESGRARALYELAISQPVLDMPEALWKAYIDFEIAQVRGGGRIAIVGLRSRYCIVVCSAVSCGVGLKSCYWQLQHSATNLLPLGFGSSFRRFEPSLPSWQGLDVLMWMYH